MEWVWRWRDGEVEMLALMKDCVQAEECKSVRALTFDIPFCDTTLSERTNWRRRKQEHMPCTPETGKERQRQIWRTGSRTFKGIVHPKMNFCHRVLTLMSFQTCGTFFLPSVEHKRRSFFPHTLQFKSLGSLRCIYLVIF